MERLSRCSRYTSAALTMVVFACAALLAGGCQTGPVPAAEFVIQADQLHDQALRSAVTSDTDLHEYMDEVGRRIIAGATALSSGNTRDSTLANMQFHLVESSEINAFATGGRHVYIYAGLLRTCETEEELAAVMCHEYAHALDLDLQKTGLRPDPKNATDQVAYLMVAHRTTPVMEAEADARGFDIYARGGWDPNRFYTLFERIADRFSGSPAALDRPTPAARSAAGRALAQRFAPTGRNWRQPTVADPQTFQQLRAKAAAMKGEQTTPANPAWLYLRAFPNCILPGDTPAEQDAQQQLRDMVTPKLPKRQIEAS